MHRFDKGAINSTKIVISPQFLIRIAQRTACYHLLTVAHAFLVPFYHPRVSSKCFYRSYESHQITIIVFRLSHLNGSSPPILLFRELNSIVDTTMRILLKLFSYDIIEKSMDSLSLSFPFSRYNLKASHSL